MNRTIIKLLIFFMLPYLSFGARLKGKVTTVSGEPLAFASIYIKGTTKGTTTNVDGYFGIDLDKGTYTFICRYVGYEKQEKELDVNNEIIELNFVMKTSGKELKQLKVSAGEDRALKVIRNTIKKRSEYNKQIDAYKANAYIKGNFKLDEVTTNKSILALMGMSGKDSSSKKGRDEMEESKGILMLSESYNEVYYKKPDKLKVIVKSSRVSGKSGSYGFSEPLFINMYDNNVDFGEQLSPRGFLSPIAETAMLSYKYELLDIYQEDGKTINVIQVIPRRKFEPLFSGILHIIQDEWRIHSLDLTVDKNHQLELLDTIRIKQIFVPINNVLMVKDQSFRMKLNLFGFSATGNFVNVFTDYVFDYDTKKTFNKFKREYDKDALTKTKAFWDENRPVPLDQEEQADFIKKDSLEKVNKAKPDTVSLEKNGLKKILLRGYSTRLKQKQRLSTTPLISLNTFAWNTVEGLNMNYGIRFEDNSKKDKRYDLGLRMRYGFNNKQFNAKLNASHSYGKTNKKKLSLSLGRYIFQYNNAGPINELINSYYTLWEGRNYMKFYQAWFANARFQYKLVSGLGMEAQLNYQDRMPMGNTTDLSRLKDAYFTENYPVEKINHIEPRHQALSVRLKASYQPGRKYIKYPDRIEATSSKYPNFTAQYKKGLNILNSDVDYDQWQLSVDDEMNLRMWGTFMYQVHFGGFINSNEVFVADYTHFNGNQTILASPYLNSFQLSPYYMNSNVEPFYTSLHVEHHFFGLITNKIPLFRKLKWYLVGGSNAYYVNQDQNYVEVSAGLENVGFKLFRFVRVDAVAGYTNFKNPVFGIRIGLSSSFVDIERTED